MGDEPVVPIVGDGGSAGEVEPPREVELAPGAAVETGRVRRGRRAPLLVALAVVVVGGLSAAAFLGAGDDPDPDETLDAAQAAVGRATSFRFTVSGATVMSFGDDANGTDTTTRFTGTGAWAGTRWQLRSGSGFAETEVVVDGNTTYLRFAEPDAALDDQLWQSWDSEPQSYDDLLEETESLTEEDVEGGNDILDGAGFRDTLAVGLAESIYLGTTDGPMAAGGEGVATGMVDSGFMVDPSGFVDAIRRMGEPKLVDNSGGATTLAMTLEAPADLVEAWGAPLPTGKVELDVGADDLPTALRLDVAAGESSSTTEIELSAWNEPVEIAVPSDDEIDPNPMLDEASLRSLEDLAPVWPTDPPDDWSLTVFGPDETADMEVTGDCEAIELDWDNLDDESDEGDHFWVVERPVDCALATDPTPFAPGGPGGLPSRPGGDFGTVEVQVGDTAVEIDSTLEGVELDAVIASLAPVDVETLISAVPADIGFEL